MKIIYFFITIILLNSCYGINEETSVIGGMSPECLDSLAWKKMCEEHSIDRIEELELLLALDEVENHFIKPDYILYFKEAPEEIVGCDWYSIRVVFNKDISSSTLTGLSTQLSNKEQKRIRNRVFKELMKYQCAEGRIETLKQMEEDVPFADSHKEYGLLN